MTTVTRSRRVGQPSLQFRLDDSFEYIVRRQRRKTIALHVLPDASVEVRAPKWVPNRELAAFVEQRADWVVARRREAMQKLAQRPSFIPGQLHYFLGQRYPLSLSRAPRAVVQWEQGVFHVATADPADPAQVERALERWYRQRALGLFEERLFACIESFPAWFQDRYPPPELKIRKMRRRWGSCSSRGVITLNLALVKMPLECIDYVICHELCHLQEFHHGRAFYQLLAQVVPAWKQRESLVELFADC